MAGEKKKDEQAQAAGSQGQVDLRGAYDTAGVGGVSSPDTESASRSAQYSAGTQYSSNTQQSSSTQRTGVEGLSDELQAQKEQETAQALSAQGVEIDPATGQLRVSPNSGTIGDLLGMRESAEEAERRARLKKTASGLYQSLATISDIISGAAGGNVYKREKDTTIADAEKDVQQRKDALLAAEMAAKEQDRKRLEKAAQMAAAINARYDALRNKVSTSEGTASREGNTQSESIGIARSKTGNKTNGATGGSLGTGGGVQINPNNTMTFSIGQGDGSGTYSGYRNFTVDKASGRRYADKAVQEMLRLYKSDTTNAASKKQIRDQWAAIGIDIDNYDTTKQVPLTDEQVQTLMNLGMSFNTNGLDKELNELYRRSPEYAAEYTRLVSSDAYKKADENGKKKMLQGLDIQLIPNKDTHEKVKFDFGEDKEVASDVAKGGA